MLSQLETEAAINTSLDTFTQLTDALQSLINEGKISPGVITADEIDKDTQALIIKRMKKLKHIGKNSDGTMDSTVSQIGRRPDGSIRATR